MHDTVPGQRLSVNDNGGAIFLYEYDGSVWNQIWFLAGDWRRSWRTLLFVGGWLEIAVRREQQSGLGRGLRYRGRR
jgi:hypothetical protein